MIIHILSRLRILAITAIAGALVVFGDADNAIAADEPPVFMFVHIAEDLDADPENGKIRLINVSQQILFFSDRPERIAGHLKMDDYLKEWTSVEDDFNDNPPNAALSVYEPDQNKNVVSIVELMNPVIDGNDIVYDFKLLKGAVPSHGGATSLFIDRIGIGGGVGLGYHGVGVGLRGPGVL